MEDQKLHDDTTRAISDGLTPDVFKTLLENQAKELELKAIELALQKQQDDHGFEFGKAALLAKIEDRKLQRNHQLSVKKSTYVLVTILALIVSSIIIYALYSNNSPIAMEIIKAIVYLTGGSLGGYGVAKAGAKTKDSGSNNSDQPDS
jgi:multisubunit Na+/H+ antiporter MnhG subunit